MSKWQRALLWTGILGISGLAGCASQFANGKDPGAPPMLIPASATRVAEGPAPLSYIPTGPSTIYILDNTSESLMNTSDSQGVADHMFFFIDPVEKSVLLKSTINPSERIVLASPIDPGHRFSIWVVQPSMMRAAPPATQP